MFCKNCGQQLADDQKFCHRCGTKIEHVINQTDCIPSKSDVTPQEAEPVKSIPNDDDKESVNSVIDESSDFSDNSTDAMMDQVGEIYFTKKWVKITVISVAAFCLLMAVLTFSTPLEFDWFLGSCKYWQGFSILFLFSLVLFLILFGEHRHARIYLNSEGKLDIETPRNYVALKKPAIVRFMGRNRMFGGDMLSEFEYADGRIRITTEKSEYLEAPLSELTWKYSMTKPKDYGDWYIYKYELIDKSGNSVKFYRNNATFEDEEWDDINMLLSLCETVSENKVSKISKKLQKIAEAAKDFDYSDIAGSIKEVVVFEGTNKVIDLVRAKIYGNAEKKKGLWQKIKKLFGWIWLVIVVIYILAVLLYNVCVLVDYLFDSDSESETTTMIDSSAEDEFSDKFTGSESEMESSASSTGASKEQNRQLFFENCGEDYFECTFEDGDEFLLSFVPETGDGFLLTPAGELYELILKKENNTRTSLLFDIVGKDEKPTGMTISVDAVHGSIMGFLNGLDGSQKSYEGWLQFT